MLILNLFSLFHPIVETITDSIQVIVFHYGQVKLDALKLTNTEILFFILTVSIFFTQMFLNFLQGDNILFFRDIP